MRALPPARLHPASDRSYRPLGLSTKTTKLARELLDRFFREAEGQPDRKIDAFFIIEADGIGWERAEPAIDFLKSRGLIEMPEDSVYLTKRGIEIASTDQDISGLPMHQKTWAGQAVSAAVATPPVATPAVVAPTPPQPTARPSGQSAPPVAAAPTPAAPARPKVPRLVFTDGDGAHKIENLGWSLVLGRAEEADLTLKDARASKRHCEVRYEGGRYVLEDLGSANGTVVNGSFITRVDLQHGDLLLVGRTELVYECPERIPEPAGEPAGAGVADTIPPPASTGPASSAPKPKIVVPPMDPPPKPIIPAPARSSAPAPAQIVRGRPESVNPTPAAALFVESEPTRESDAPDLFATAGGQLADTATEAPDLPGDRRYDEALRPSGPPRARDDDDEATVLAPTPFDEPDEKTAPPKHTGRLELPRLERAPPTNLASAEARTVEHALPSEGPHKLASWSDALGTDDTNPPFFRPDEAVTPVPAEGADDAPEAVLEAAAELPEAPESPDDFSGDISGDIASESPSPTWTRFEALLAGLETAARSADIPEKGQVLEAIQTLRTHPFVRSALGRTER